MEFKIDDKEFTLSNSNNFVIICIGIMDGNIFEIRFKQCLYKNKNKTHKRLTNFLKL